MPGGPTYLTATTGSGGSFSPGTYYYVVTATWLNLATGAAGQSPLSNEVSLTLSLSDSAVLSWTEPDAVTDYTVTGYQVWRGDSPGGEDALLATLGGNTTSYTDSNAGGGGETAFPVMGGTAGPVVWMSPRSSQGYWRFQYTPPALPTAWINVTSTTAQAVGLPGSRSITDGEAEDGSTTFTSPDDADFTGADVGVVIGGPGIPAGTTISSVTDSTTVVMSAAATADGSDLTVVIGAQIQGYPAVVDSWSNATGDWSDGTTVWWVGANGETPASGTRYPCRLLGVDVDGVAIWSWTIPSAAPVYTDASNESVVLTTDFQDISAFRVTATSSGWYALIISVQGRLQAASTIGTYIILQLSINGTPYVGSGGQPPAFNSVQAVNVPVYDVCTWIFADILNAGDVLTLQAKTSDDNANGYVGVVDGYGGITAMVFSGVTAIFP